MDSHTPIANVSFNRTIEINDDGDNGNNSGDNMTEDSFLDEIHFEISENGNKATHATMIEEVKSEMIDLKQYFHSMMSSFKEEIIFENQRLIKELANRETPVVEGRTRTESKNNQRITQSNIPTTIKKSSYEKWLLPKKVSQVKRLDSNKFHVKLNNRYESLDVENSKQDVINENQAVSSSFDENAKTSQNSSSPGRNFSAKKKQNPSSYFNKHPERQGQKALTLSLETGPKIALFTDSIPKRFNMTNFNKKVVKGGALLVPFPGADSRRLNYHSVPTLRNESPDIAVIHVGINDLLNRICTVDEIVNEIKSMAENCKNFDVKKVFISSVIFSTKVRKAAIDDLNEKLKHLCDINGFGYISNENIKENSLWTDGLHLNNFGKNILFENFLYYLNYFLYQEQNSIKFP